MIDVDDLIQQARELDPLPASVVRLSALVSSGKTDLDEIAEVITYDQALTMKLLRSANSAYGGGTMVLTSARDAVFRLGTARVLSLSIAGNVNTMMKADLSAYGLDEGELWKHSVASAVAAEVLPDFCRETLPSETFTAALLHDIGKLIMSRFLTKDIIERLHQAQVNDGLSPLQAEDKILQIHHGEVGGIIAERWEMPETIVRGITHHHTPEDTGDLICFAVCLANIMAKSLRDDKRTFKVLLDITEPLGISPTKIDLLITVAKDRFEKISARYNAL